ncbi:MAG: deoxyribonuclease IV [Phycisphaerae bacterium]|nr:deoxyribonuclease IV [Phycisphaerae bacterium]
MFGSHLSIAGGMVNALTAASAQGMDCVQVFTKNQRQWKAKPLVDEDVDLWISTLKGMGWDETNRIVSHNSYLVNMASPDATSRQKSIALQLEEIERCEQLHIPFLVSHPGARLGTPRKRGEPNALDTPISEDELGGLKRIVDSLDEIHASLPGYKTITCLETTVGSGTNLGYDFKHLGWIREHVQEPARVGFCFDTCHITAGGYDMSTPTRAKKVLDTFDHEAGTQHIKVFHFNDSVGDVGSRLDRHAHIGEGTCGKSCFRSIVQHPAFVDVPKILETSKEENSKGELMDVVNIAKLRKMAKTAKKHR